MKTHTIPLLPLPQEVETKVVLKQLAKSERALGELKGMVQKVPNQAVLINTIFLQEAKASSEIENIITTNDELFRTIIDSYISPNAKEVQNYNTALNMGFKKISHEPFLLLNKDIKEIQAIIKSHNAGFRTQTGTTLKNQNGEIIYTPPQNAEEINTLMANLEKFINDDEMSDINPLIKMAIIHHQFESIHPFYDGNGRVGRIINILYLVLKGLLDIPVLYLSRYIIDNKATYYSLLQKVRDEGSWEEWILFILKGIEQTSRQTTKLTESIIDLMNTYKHEIRNNYPKMYSQDLINALFKHPYTKIDFLSNDINCNRQTAAKYLNNLSEHGFLKKEKFGKSNYYINEKLCELFINVRAL